MERWRGWAVVTAASGTVLIGAGAFWLSFTALADLAVRSGIGGGQAWIWPLLVDGLIVVATVAVVALDGHRAAWYPWALLIGGALVSVIANAAHALVTAEASAPGLLAATVAAVPPLVLLASTHLTVVLIRSTRTTTTPPQTEEPLPALPAGTAPDTPAPRSATEPDDPSPQHEDEVGPTAPTTPESHESAPTGVGADRRERAARLREAGWSNKQIARELDVHPSTVGRWFPRRPEAEVSESSGPQEAGTPPEHSEEEPS
ncbi:DUF2637 domain-containing protein [Brevibacterium sp. p3-SID960]|uniref:DUF2637 domain-containing protein n=1 Tax=Brevibacterium sp. p3-SID960 TaxID=2916063 RepID=UPI0021A5CCDC|nr:DUF2637 domain-containing protein [Brevibacterium sp. p3-SID960]MCT1691330.1 DUF2637 domain-containing protein [Brevibacterium sp. p3-SID960]